MPFIVEATPINNITAEVNLPLDGLEVDPRVIKYDRHGCRCEISVEGRVLKVTIVAESGGPLRFRVYNPATETVPEFNTKSYTYFGLEHEEAPYEVEEVIVHPSVRVILRKAFYRCLMKRCIMGDQVLRIEEEAFYWCRNLRNIRLSKALNFIGTSAFERCYSLDSLFLPSSVQEIEQCAFMKCQDMKILALPRNIDLAKIRSVIVIECDTLLSTMQYVKVESEEWPGEFIIPNDSIHEVNQWLINRYSHLPLLDLCTRSSVTAPMICEVIREHGTNTAYETENEYDWTPLHILMMNPYTCSNWDAIVTCFSANPSALFCPDATHMTPLDYLWNGDGNFHIIVHLVQYMCLNMKKGTTGTQ